MKKFPSSKDAHLPSIRKSLRDERGQKEATEIHWRTKHSQHLLGCLMHSASAIHQKLATTKVK